jgi:hypothetical protein
MTFALTPIPLLLLQLAATGATAPQPPATTPAASDLQIYVRGYTISDDGGEHSGVALSSGAVVVGTPTLGAFSFGDCGYFTVTGRTQEFREQPTAAWRLEITPIRISGRAVTFRLRWVRAIDSSKSMSPAGEDVEVTLRSGEVRPIDSAPVPARAKTFNDSPCKTSGVSLRVSVEPYPLEEFERRLVAADLWLIERLPNGTERSQTQALRGLPNRAIPFYFDSIVEGSQALDILGRIIARPDGSAIELDLRTRSRWGESAALNSAGRTENPWRWIESVIVVKPGEIVDVALPKLGEGAGVFAQRTYKIRVRARQLR